MKNIQTLSNEIDSQVAIVRRFVQNGDTYNSMMQVAKLGGAIDLYREAIKAEMDGLKGDVKSAEAAYENAHAACNALEDEKDDWLNKKLPGWRKRVTEAERQRDHWKNDHDRVAKEKYQVEKALKSMTLAKDEWKQEAAASETRLEAAIEAHERTKSNLGSVAAELEEMRSQRDLLRDAYDNQKTLTRNALSESRKICDDFYELKKHAVGLELRVAELSIVDAEWSGPEFAEVGESPKQPSAPYLAVDNGEAGGDRSVVSWVCTCGKRKTLTAPKIPLWTYQDHCGCGAITSLNYDD